METENLISIAEEQTEFMSSLFVAINHEAEKLGLPMIQRLAAQGQYWADTLANELDCHLEVTRGH